MSKKLIILLVLALVVGFTAVAFAEVQNVKISGDLTVNGIIRNQLDLKGSTGTADAGNADAWISTTRVKIDANLTDNVDVTFRLLNERGWGSATGYTGTDYTASQVDVAQAFVTMKEMMKDTVGFPWTMIVGKQSVKLGSGLLIGASGTNRANNTQLPLGLGDFAMRSSFDGIVNVLDFSPLTVTAAFIKAAEGVITTGRDTNIYAVNAVYDLGADSKNTKVEGIYVLSAKRKDNIQNLGARVTSKPIENLGVEAEYVYQTARTDGAGDYFDDKNKTKNSDAVRLAASYALPDVTWKPSLGADFTRLSKRWNVMQESLSPASLANLIFAGTDVTCIGASVSAKPMDDMKLNFRFANFNLAKKWIEDDFGTTYSAASATGYTYEMEDGKKGLGNEYDLGLAYDYTADVQFGLNYGLFVPGKAFHAGNRKSASQVVGSMKVTF